MKKVKCLLEYSNEQQSMHINCWNNRDSKWDNVPETNGYETICETDYDTVKKFLETNMHSHSMNANVLRIAWLAFNTKI